MKNDMCCSFFLKFCEENCDMEYLQLKKANNDAKSMGIINVLLDIKPIIVHSNERDSIAKPNVIRTCVMKTKSIGINKSINIDNRKIKYFTWFVIIPCCTGKIICTHCINTFSPKTEFR